MHFSCHIILLSLFTFLVTMMHANVQEDLKKEMDDPTDDEDYVANGKYYNEEGNLFYYGDEEGYSDKLTLYFKKEAALSTPYFNITFCLNKPTIPTCTRGITLCYKSQIKVKYNREEYRGDSFVLRKRQYGIECEESDDFGIRVMADEKHFTVQATLDNQNYKFPIPSAPINESRCFVLKMGSDKSLETTITNEKGEQLIFVGNAPKKFEENNPKSLFYSKNDKTMNLWMLFIDFTPFYLPSWSYFPRPIYFLGGGKKCGLSAEFDTESFHVCKQAKEFIGSCVVENLDSADMECTGTLMASQSVEEGKENERSSSNTDEKSETKTYTSSESETDTSSESETKIKSEENGTALEISEQIKMAWEIEASLFGTGAKISMDRTTGRATTSEEKHVRGTEKQKGSEKSNTKATSTSNSKTTTKSKTTGTSEMESLKEVTEKGKTVEIKIHRTDGGEIKLYQLALFCSGDVKRYHKIFAVGDKDHETSPQATTVYEWRNESQKPTFNLVLPGVKSLVGMGLDSNIAGAITKIKDLKRPERISSVVQNKNPIANVEEDNDA